MRRRSLLLGAGIALAAPAMLAGRPARPDDGIDLEAALAPRFVGDPGAKVVLAEYFSLTCPHCARFHVGAYPKIVEKYVDTGKVRIELRDFPLDGAALRAAALARCLPARQYAAMIDVLLRRQASWAGANDVLGALVRVGKLAGLSEGRARACMANEKLLDGILEIRLEGTEKYDVRSTPSFVLDGEKISAFEFEEFDALLSRAVS